MALLAIDTVVNAVPATVTWYKGELLSPREGLGDICRIWALPKGTRPGAAPLLPAVRD
jgi:hypothetical protein